MVIYTVFKNGELIYLRNFKVENGKEGIKRIEETYEDIKGKDNITDIQYEQKKLEFNSYDEKHIIFLK